ncbi:MAG: hypothetical protein IJA34_00595 [Lachnospiraceae bacterium]|nr:hypothetical protein [Lachnospiraceae bacterium]
MITRDMVHLFIEEFKKEEMVKKNLYEYIWVSGSSTKVYPITIWIEGAITSDIVIQWKNDKRCTKFINKIVKKYNDILEEGYFWKSDGSCPSTITFRLKEKIKVS